MPDVVQQPRYEGAAAIDRAARANDLDALREMIVGVALHEEDLEIAQSLCRRFSVHDDEIVRGNAILGFGHLARLSRDVCHEASAIVAKGLRDESEYVRGQAYPAASDLRHFLGRDVPRPD
jgi:hypothetical protein